MMSYDKYTFLPITRDRIELETWDRHQCVRLDLAHQMICNTTWLGQFVTLTFGQGHYLTFSMRSHHTSIDLSRRGEHDGAIVVALTLKTRKLLAKQNLGKFLGIFVPWGRNFSPDQKSYRSSFVMIFDDLSIAFSASLYDAQEPS